MASYEPVQLAFNTVEPDGCLKDKAPILFLHGVAASKEQWGDIPEAIAKATKRKVYVVDSRNHGDSPWTDVFNFDCNVDDLLFFLDSIGVPKAVIVGHSMGGITGMKVALRAPERVEKLVVVDINCRKTPLPLLRKVLRYLFVLKASVEKVPSDVDENTARKKIFESLFHEINIAVKPEELNFRIQLKKSYEGRWILKSSIDLLIKGYMNPQTLMTEPTGVYEGPTCFIYGKLSPFQVGLNEQSNRKFFPHAEMIGIDNANHSVHSDCPQVFTDALLNFLQA